MKTLENSSGRESRLTEFIQDVLITIHENLRELNERKAFADPGELDYIETRIATYQEVLATIRMSADTFDLRQEIGI